MYTHICTYKYPHMQVLSMTDSSISAQIYAYPHIHMCTYMYMNVYVPTYTCTHMYPHTLVCMYAYPHRYICTHKSKNTLWDSTSVRDWSVSAYMYVYHIYKHTLKKAHILGFHIGDRQTHLCAYVCVPIYIYTHTKTHTFWVCISVTDSSIYAHMYVNTYICTHTHKHKKKKIVFDLCDRLIRLYAYVCVYIYMYTHTHKHTFWFSVSEKD